MSLADGSFIIQRHDDDKGIEKKIRNAQSQREFAMQAAFNSFCNKLFHFAQPTRPLFRS